MAPDSGPVGGEGAERVTPLPVRNEMHYDGRVFEQVDWSNGEVHMFDGHGITIQVANEALGDPYRVLIDPDYNSKSGSSVRIIGLSVTAETIITVIVLEHDGIEYGVNGWVANTKDRRLYNEGAQDERD